MKNISSEDSGFKKFLRENKSLKYMLPMLFVLIVIFIITLVSGTLNGEKNIPVSQNSDGLISNDDVIDISLPQVEILPQIIRSNNLENTEVKKDPFEAVMKLVGVIYSGPRSTAIIEWGDYSYIVKANDKVGDSEWSVVNIEKNSITLKSDEDRVVLDLSYGDNYGDNN